MFIVKRSSKFPKFLSHIRILIEVWKKPEKLEIVKYKLASFEIKFRLGGAKIDSKKLKVTHINFIKSSVNGQEAGSSHFWITIMRHSDWNRVPPNWPWFFIYYFITNFIFKNLSVSAEVSHCWAVKFNVKKSKPSYSFSSIIFHSKTPSSQAEKFLFDNQRLIIFQTYVIKNIAKIWVIRFLDFFYKHFHSSLKFLRSNGDNITRCNKGAFVRISPWEMKI